jgi:thiol-disulfide isomerase/thioredoxin|tara:strand:+ start:5270 stop:5641 length:372 start_codon:yes stop_codon:yes gene_type:complete
MLHQEGSKTYVVNFWATWCAPCIKELPYFEALNKNQNIDVLLVSLDFPQHKESRLLPFIKKNQLQSKVVHLDDTNENFWINAIDTTWSGAIPATIIYNNQKRGFYERLFTQKELETLVESFNP